MITNFFSIVLAFCFLFVQITAKGQQRELSLKDALALARSGNRSLQVQRLAEQVQKQQSREQRAALRPDLSFQGSLLHYFDRQVIFMPGSFLGTSEPVRDLAVGGTEAFSAGIMLTQPLLHESARLRHQVAGLDEVIAHETTLDLESRLACRVAVLYYEIVLLQRELDFIERSLSRQASMLADARSLCRHAQATGLDTLRSVIELQKRESARLQLLNRLADTRDQLRDLLALPEEEVLSLSDSVSTALQTFFPQEKEALPGAEPSELRIQRLETIKSVRQMRSLKAERLPRAYLVGAYQVQAQGDALNQLGAAWPRTSYLGLQISLPLLSGGKTRARIAQSLLRLEQDKQVLADKQSRLNNETRALVNDLADARQRLVLHRSVKYAAEVNYRLLSERFKAGMATRLELIDGELSLTESENACLRVEHEIFIAGLELMRLSGTLALNDNN